MTPTIQEIPDFECADGDQVSATSQRPTPERSNTAGILATYLMIGVLLGFVFVRSEVVSWYRIQEMFRFQSFHMYGIIGSAVMVAAVSVQLIRRSGLRTMDGEAIVIAEKAWGTHRLRGVRYWLGGTLFGLGWALTGACPGPMFALVGSGISVMLAAIAAAMAGTWGYATLQRYLPH